jgi:para-aminobenzoate synthetase component 1
MISAAAIQDMNRLGNRRIPFLFVLPFDTGSEVVVPLVRAAEEGIWYNFRGAGNVSGTAVHFKDPLRFRKYPPAYTDYLKAFGIVMSGLQRGDSYLLNLTFPTPVEINRSLADVFYTGSAPYRLLFRDEFTVFSPECFVRILGNTISSFPMKGTIDAGIPGAAGRLISDAKEMAEHHTIVDLIRNDLSMVASEVRVKRFRYLEEIGTHERRLLQASSEISGMLFADWPSRLGEIFAALLPAGSISGAPKAKTLEIIRKAETSDRGYYTGVCGIFDGEGLDSAVMIRFLAREGGNTVFRSGGGITINSNPESEYRELIDKVYVPIV